MFESKYFELFFSAEKELAAWVAVRDGEVRLGEQVVFRGASDQWKSCRFHVLGICEDIGPRLNLGRSGAQQAFGAFISRFLNMQSNRFLSGKEVCVHGWIQPKTGSTSLNEALIQDLDDLVASWMYEVVSLGGIPVVIGGGHNNAYPLIKGSSLALNEALSVVNMDPHADTRALEGRHSGNPFSYADHEGFLKQYAVLGLHESYNNQTILDTLDKMQAFYSFYELWLDKPSQFCADIEHVLMRFADQPAGVELDMDAIAWMPTSAFTPSGIGLDQARMYVRKMATLKRVCYVHFPEAAPNTVEEEMIVGKALAYLVVDFIKEYNKHHADF